MQSFERRSLVVGIGGGLLVGLLLGMLLFWQAFPVKWTDAHSYDLSPDAKAEFVGLVAESFKLNRDPIGAAEHLALWTAEEKQAAFAAAAAKYDAEGQPEKALAVKDLGMVLGVAEGPAAEEAEVAPTGLLDRLRVPCLTFVGVLLALVLGWIGVRAVRARRTAQKAAGGTPRFGQRAPRAEEAGPSAVKPLGKFATTYKMGEDAYDESFSIETATGEFLGECGVGISDTIGSGEPEKVSAFEVWLFDKSDIRTVTKVLLSAHAYQDEEVRARLASKGEAVLADQDTPFFLETSGLKLQVSVTDLEYGDEELAPDSLFSRLGLELVAYAKTPGNEFDVAQ